MSVARHVDVHARRCAQNLRSLENSRIRAGNIPATNWQVTRRSDEPQHVSYPLGGRQVARFNPDESTEVTPAIAIQLMMLGKTGSFGLPGIVAPPIKPASSATTPEDADVVGVRVKGHYRAYCISEMQTPFTHVINDIIDRVAVTVTFCNRSSCARVFTKPDELDRPLDVGVGGFSDGQMLLHVGSRNFSQNSPNVPLQDLEFERTTWEKWKRAHPDTDICTGLDPAGSWQTRSATPDVTVPRGNTGDVAE